MEKNVVDCFLAQYRRRPLLFQLQHKKHYSISGNGRWWVEWNADRENKNIFSKIASEKGGGQEAPGDILYEVILILINSYI